MVENVIIMGAAGRDFHNFNVFFRDSPRYRVVAFTAAQIPDIAGRHYPPSLAGAAYPAGIPIYPEDQLPELIRRFDVNLVVFAYSDIDYEALMHRAALVHAAGAGFLLLGARQTMLEARVPVVSVCAVRTGCGKSPTTRKVCEILQGRGRKVVAVRHPMPYGDLAEQAVQRFTEYGDFERHGCTIEEREEYEPLVEMGVSVYAGIDYRRILDAAQREADIVVWDGGNNDTPFFRPDLHIVLFDPHRAGHESRYWPGESNMLMADIAIVGKVDSAAPEKVEQLRETIRSRNPRAELLLAESELLVDRPGRIRGRRVLVVEDGPTLTHGEMAFGAGWLAARKFGAGEIVDPRPCAVGSLRETFAAWPHLENVLPAMGYGRTQIRELEQTINAVECDIVLFATPIHLPRLLRIERATLRVRYAYRDHGEPTLESVLDRHLSPGRTHP